MRILEAITYSGHVPDMPIVTISVKKLIKFLIVYPEVVSDALTMSNLIPYLENDKEGKDFMVYDGDYKYLFLSMECWLKHVIQVQISKEVTKINFKCDIIRSHDKPYLITLEADPIVSSFKCDSSSPFGFTFTKLIAGVTNPAILYNIAILREVQGYAGEQFYSKTFC